jgi:feruloyl esterase
MIHPILKAAILVGAVSVSGFAGTCSDLARLSLVQAKIDSAEEIAAGQYAPPEGADNRGVFKDLPSFCRVKATLKPSSDSDIKIEVWLPASNWNGNFQGVSGGGGNGALEGALETAGLAGALRSGFATATTDTGHEGATFAYAIDHPERLIDYGHRAVHVMTVQAKAITRAFYGKAPKYSYWNQCASGGRYGLSEAQRYPDDYDGIVVSAPASYWTHLQTWSLYVYKATHDNPLSDIPKNKYPLLHKAAIEACDALDGLKDGLIGDPRKCKFDPATLLCQGQDAATCLTTAQVEAARKIYSPLLNPRTKTEIFPRLLPGSELGWAGLASGEEEPRYVRETFRYLAFKDPNWSEKAHPVDFDKDLAALDKTYGSILNANNPDLKAFFARGGKLIEWTGWSDPLIAPEDALNYYESVAKKMGGVSKIDSSFKLYMAPGVLHCRGGDGPDTFNMQTMIEDWVERGKAPGPVVAVHRSAGNVDRTRPICPYPQVAVHTGAESIDDAANFVCKVP